MAKYMVQVVRLLVQLCKYLLNQWLCFIQSYLIWSQWLRNVLANFLND